MASLKSLNSAARIAILLFSLAGFWNTWGVGTRTGFFALLKGRLQADVKLLPATEKPLRTTYTGLPLIDPLLSAFTMFLWPAIDGTWPGLCLSAFEFSGQFSGGWMIVGLEGLRLGNKGTLLTFTTIIGLCSQIITYAAILPLYLFVHLLISPTILDPGRPSRNDPATDLLVDPFKVATWPIAMTLAYQVPTFLVALRSPTYTSLQTRQLIMAFWELYPIPFMIFQLILSRWFSSTLPPDKGYKSSAQRNARALRGLRYVYISSIALGVVTHIVTLTLSLTSIFFPTIFNPDSRASFSPHAIFIGASPFVGASPFTTKPVEDMGKGLWSILIGNMNISGLATLVWATIQYRNAHEGRVKWDGWSIPLLKLSALTLAGGWTSAAGALIWARDEIVLGEAGDSEGKKYI